MRMTPRGRQVQKWRAGAASAVSTAWGATELTPAEFLQVLAEFQLTVLRYMPGPLESEEPAGEEGGDDHADTLDLAGRMTPHLASEGLYDALRNAWLRKSLTAVTDGSEVLAVVGPAFMAHLSTPTVARGDLLRAVPERGPARSVVVRHVEKNLITVSPVGEGSGDGGS